MVAGDGSAKRANGVREWIIGAGMATVSILVCLFGFELGSRLFNQVDEVTNFPSRPQPNVMQTNALHRFGHNLDDLNYVGPEPWEPSAKRLPPELRDRYEIRTSRFGFFTDYPINEFPAKEPGEYRIILIGGSGAQGHGARTNQDMFYKKLETALSTNLKDVSPRVRVINLAQSGAFAYANAVLLNNFGHGLGADLILAYNGPNDIAVPYSHRFVVPCDYGGWLMEMTFEYPPAIRPMARVFPRLFNVHGLGSWIKHTFYSDYYAKLGHRECLKQFNLLDEKGGPLDKMELYERMTRPYFASAMKSIKRDFCGIPIVLVRQTIHPGENKFYETWYGPGIYDRWWADAQRDLTGYMNGDWYFYDFHLQSHIRDNSDIPGFVPESLAIHLDNPGHVLAAQMIEKYIEPIIRSEIAAKRSKGCDA